MTKTLSFAAVHFTVAFTLTYAITGSLAAGGLVALIEPMCNTVAFHFHEKAWQRWQNRRAASNPLATRDPRRTPPALAA